MVVLVADHVFTRWKEPAARSGSEIDPRAPKLVRCGVYEQVGFSEGLVKVVELVGRRALCRVVYHLHSTVVNCFPQDEPECISKDKRWTLHKLIRDTRFLQPLDMSDRDFD